MEDQQSKTTSFVPPLWLASDQSSIRATPVTKRTPLPKLSLLKPTPMPALNQPQLLIQPEQQNKNTNNINTSTSTSSRENGILTISRSTNQTVTTSNPVPTPSSLPVTTTTQSSLTTTSTTTTTTTQSPLTTTSTTTTQSPLTTTSTTTTQSPLTTTSTTVSPLQPPAVSKITPTISSTRIEKPPTELHKWYLRRTNQYNKVQVEGLKPGSSEPWHSSNIRIRIDNRRVQTSSGNTYLLVGPMDEQKCRELGYSEFFIQSFRDGFPENWEEILFKTRDDIRPKGPITQTLTTPTTTSTPSSITPTTTTLATTTTTTGSPLSSIRPTTEFTSSQSLPQLQVSQRTTESDSTERMGVATMALRPSHDNINTISSSNSLPSVIISPLSTAVTEAQNSTEGLSSETQKQKGSSQQKRVQQDRKKTEQQQQQQQQQMEDQVPLSEQIPSPDSRQSPSKGTKRRRKLPLSYREYLKRRRSMDKRRQKKSASDVQQEQSTTEPKPTQTLPQPTNLNEEETKTIQKRKTSKKNKNSTEEVKSSLTEVSNSIQSPLALPDVHVTRTLAKKRNIPLLSPGSEQSLERKTKRQRISKETEDKKKQSHILSVLSSEGENTTQKESQQHHVDSSPRIAEEPESSLTVKTPLSKEETPTSKRQQRNIFEVPSDNESEIIESEEHPTPSPSSKQHRKSSPSLTTSRKNKSKSSSKSKSKSKSRTSRSKRKTSEETDQSLQSDTITSAVPETKDSDTIASEKLTEMTQTETKETDIEEEKSPKQQIIEEQRSTKRKKKKTPQQKSTEAITTTTITAPSVTEEKTPKTKKKKKKLSISKRELLYIQQTVSTLSPPQTRPTLSPGAISPMEISLGVSRFGRRILPPLAFWAGEVARKDAFGNIIEVTKASPTTVESPIKKRKRSSLDSVSESESSKKHSHKFKEEPKKKKSKLEDKTKDQSFVDSDQRTTLKRNSRENGTSDVVRESEDDDHSQIVTISLPLSKKTKQPDQESKSDNWSEEQLKCLRDAQRRVNPMNEFYWEEVAKYVPGKNARQCQEKIEQQFSSRREVKKTRKKQQMKVTSPINIDSNLQTRKNKRKIREALKKSGEEDMKNKDAFESTPFRTRYGDIRGYDLDDDDKEDSTIVKESDNVSNSKDVPLPNDDPMAPSEEFKQKNSLKFDEDNDDSDEDVLLKSIDRDKYDSYVNRISKITQRRQHSAQNYQEGSDEEHKSVTRQSLFKTKRKSFSSEFRKESAQLEKQKQKEEQNDEDEAAGEERDYYFDDDDESDIAE